MIDPFDLDRFIAAQRGTHADALAEVRGGAKRSHWMWFVFPQVAGLGHSPLARHYAISGVDEALSYLAHPVLGSRLREITDALLHLPSSDAAAVFGEVDAVKLRSSLTLFARAAPDGPFGEAIDRWFGGEEDPATIERLR